MTDLLEIDLLGLVVVGRAAVVVGGWLLSVVGWVAVVGDDSEEDVAGTAGDGGGGDGRAGAG